MSIVCHVKIQWEHFVSWVLGTTLLLPLVLVDAQLCCTTWFSCQRLSQTLQVKSWVWSVPGLWLHTVQRHRFTLRAPACVRTNPSRETAGKASVWQSLDEMSRGQVYVFTFLQLSVNPAVACMAPVWSPTNASAKKAGTGDTATKVSEKQTLRVISEVLHTQCYREITASKAFPASLMTLHTFFL